jgi:hypothetical protein
MRGHGRLRVTQGDHAVARAVARLLRLPPSGDAVETQLVVTPRRDGERWSRTFGVQPFNSIQRRTRDGIAERFGLVELRFRCDVDGGSTWFHQLGAALAIGPLRIPLPRALAPVVTAREDRPAPDTRRIDVRITLPIVGLLLAYSGTIETDDDDVGERMTA